MAADCSFLHSSTAFTTVFVLYCTADGTGLLLPSLVKGFRGGLRPLLHSGWSRDRSFLHSSKAFTTVFAAYCRADGSILLILALVNSFHDGFRAILLSRWQRIARSYTRQWLSRVAPHFSLRMAVRCSCFHSAWAFTVCMPYCSADGSAVLILPCVNGFHNGLRPISLILTVVYDFSDISRAVLLDGLHNILMVWVPLLSACR